MIEVKILYNHSGDLTEAYRYAVLTSKRPWVLMIDHDIVLSTNPHWYKLCLEAIMQAPDAGLFTCYTNIIGSDVQKAPLAPGGFDFVTHQAYAKAHFEKNGFAITNVSDQRKISGFFLLLRKEAVAAAELPKAGFFGVDWGLAAAVRRAGYSLWRINGLYVAHMRTRVGPFIEGEKTSKSFNP